MRTRIKICGITRVEDGLEAAQLGADAIGLVFYAQSPRAVSISLAQQIISLLPPFVTSVGLFVDASEQDIRDVLREVPLDILQFHGNEPAAACNCYGRPYLKAVRMREGLNVKTIVEEYTDAAGILLDSYQQGVPGGTGKTFDWSVIPQLDQPVILAGGLDASNVGSGIRQVKPWAVDVSGGVEADKGIKDHQKMAQFINEVQAVVTE
ncbi:MAG: phosphoribosylanthranilate isomerase [Gammaproteobacteria bacterium]|nr:phosphoribosylanthranilate isomerase [Gammaproteobacteria bacterium]